MSCICKDWAAYMKETGEIISLLDYVELVKTEES